MFEIKASLVSGAASYGYVCVRDAEGVFVRDYKITAEELAAFIATGRGAPPGMTDEEWVSGRSVVAGKPAEKNESFLDTDGQLVVKTDEVASTDGLVEHYAVIPVEGWAVDETATVLVSEAELAKNPQIELAVVP